MVKQEMNWVGLTVGNFVIEDQIGEGAFSWVHKGVHEAGLFAKAFKIAKPAELVSTPDTSDWFKSQALAFLTGYIADIHPDPAEVIALQAEKLQTASDPALISVENLVRTQGTCLYDMELIEGLTLREVIEAGHVQLEVFVRIARAMARLTANASFQYHGDLKPENILVTHSGITLIDPGHFGALECAEGNIDGCAITTPAYYPFLKPNDLLALGLILWETATGEHPLRSPGDSSEADPASIGKQLLAQVRVCESSGNFHYSGILNVRRLADIFPDINPDLSDLLLKALGLQSTPQHILEQGPCYESFGALADALSDLMTAGIPHLDAL